MFLIAAMIGLSCGALAADPSALPPPGATWVRIQSAFQPPAELEQELGPYRSPLIFDNGRPVTAASQWPKRREEILRFWHGALGPWPPLIDRPQVEVLETLQREAVLQKKVRFQAGEQLSLSGYLLQPVASGRRPAVLVVYYEPETSAGLNQKAGRDFGWQLARRGFVTLSIGWPESYTSAQSSKLQPLSCLAYIAANSYNALASLPEVDPDRVGVVGHSFGGKWAMFAACLDQRFACAAWSDPGIVFDERRPNVNYWEPWYLGWEAGRKRQPGVPTEENPRTGPYRQLIESGHDLHELHALMAPRPFLVSGGAEDRLERWTALNHSRAVNRLLGYRDRVGMTNRPGHGPTVESNEQLYAFFEHFLQPEQAEARPSVPALQQ